MPSLVPVDHDPFAAPASGASGKLTPVDHDPFAKAPIQAETEEQVQAAEKATGMLPKSQWELFQAGLSAIAKDPSLLLQVGPGRIPGAIKSGVTLPADVATGREQMPLPTENPDLSRVADLAGLASPMRPSGLPRAHGVPEPVAASAPVDMVVRAPRLEAVETGARAGMDIPRVATMPNFVQKGAAGLSDLPIVGAPLQQAAERAITQGEARVGELAQSVGVPSRAGGGAAAQEGIRQFKADAIPALEKEVYAPINASVPKDARFVPANTVQAIAEVQGRLGESAGKLGGELARVQRALEENKGNLTFQAIQDLRSALGAEMRAPIKREGYDEGAAARLYGTLTDDLRDATRTVGGPELAAAWDTANATAAQAWQQFKSVRGLAGETVSPNAAFEQVFSLAMDKRGNAGKLAKLRQTVGPDAWKDISATAIDRMGKNNSDQFSMQFFVNNHTKMDPGARNILFGEANRAVSDLAASFKTLQNMERYKSKSQSGNVLASAGGTAGLLTEPFTTAVTAIAGYAGARWLAKPATASSMAAWTKAYAGYVRNPTKAVGRALEERAKTVGSVIATEAGAPTAAPAIAAELQNALRAVNDNLLGTSRGAATESDEK